MRGGAGKACVPASEWKGVQMISYESVDEARGCISARTEVSPKLGVILGSGLAGAVENMDVDIAIPFSEVPNMRASTNPAHPGKFVMGTLFGQPTICMQGRIHMYEGYTVEEVAFPVFLMKLLGVEKLVVTNAAGAINTDYGVQDFVLIKDHINFMAQNPLRLNLDSRLGEPCCDMTYAYSPEMRAKARAAAEAEGRELAEGVYIGVFGPSFETPAEIRAFRSWGADLVGMSTVPEVIAASSAGMEVFGVSLVTNMAAGIVADKISLDDVYAVREDVPARLGRIIESAVA